MLAPARNLETGRVAVDCGADAVYIGGPGFGARLAAGNSLEDVAALVRYAHPFGVRVYATLNTLLFDDELEEAERVARGLLDAGVDALIVQDMAFLRMGLSEVEFHASTQTSNIAPDDVAFLGYAGFRRVILERALSLNEIKRIRAATDAELEVFIHGAICVGYSGRCFFSRSTSRRSGNRGDCSQPCRLAYDLVDGERRVLLKGKHLLSVCDLDLGARVGELLDAGATSFKIEGRLKDANYVRNVVSHYRWILDTALETRPEMQRASVGVSVPDFVPNPVKSFTRGGSGAGGANDYFFDGMKKGVASFDTPKAMGEPAGRVKKVDCERTGNRFFTLEDHAVSLSAGDGICFFTEGELRGTGVNRVEEGGRIYPDKFEGIMPKTEVYRNYDHAFARALEGSRMKRRIDTAVSVSMSPSCVEMTFTDETGVSVAVVREGTFEPARDPGKMSATVREQFTRSGDTIFEVREVTPAESSDSCAMPLYASSLRSPASTLRSSESGDPAGFVPFIPVSMLASMRREGLEGLFEARKKLSPERNPAVEDVAARFPRTSLTAADNVSNRLAERFYRDHGVTEIEPALELRGAESGEEVMRSRYCIRREIGECLKDGSKLRVDLYLERGNTRWGLRFDCDKCQMAVLKI